MTENFEAYKANRLGGNIPAQACRLIGVSLGAAYKFEKKLKALLPEAEYAALPHSLRKRPGISKTGTKDDLLVELARLRQQLRDVEIKADPLPETHSLTSLGVLAEDYAYYRLRRLDFEVYRPGHAVTGTDLVVINEHRRLRVEVKACANDRSSVGVQCTRQRQNGFYEEGQVDFFILVDLIKEYLFVLPSSEISTISRFTLSPESYAWQFKDRFDLLRK